VGPTLVSSVPRTPSEESMAKFTATCSDSATTAASRALTRDAESAHAATPVPARTGASAAGRVRGRAPPAQALKEGITLPVLRWLAAPYRRLLTRLCRGSVPHAPPRA